MKYTLSVAVSCLVLITSQAHAGLLMIWRGVVIDVEHSTYRDFTLSTSETAYLALPADGPGLINFTAADGGSVAAFFADMTDGENDPLTWSTSTFSYTVDENHGFIHPITGGPVHAVSEYITRDAVDLAGWTIDYIRVQRFSDEGQRQYYIEVHGNAPEPTTAAMFLFGIGCCLAHVRTGPRRR